MFISNIVYSANFRAAANKDASIPSEEEFFKILRSGTALPLSSVNEVSGNTLFHSIVKADYTRLISYLCGRGIDFKDLINVPNREGLSPLDDAKSQEMQIILKRLGGKSLQGSTESAAVPATANDAKVIAAQQYMTEPVMQKLKNIV